MSHGCLPLALGCLPPGQSWADGQLNIATETTIRFGYINYPKARKLTHGTNRAYFSPKEACYTPANSSTLSGFDCVTISPLQISGARVLAVIEISAEAYFVRIRSPLQDTNCLGDKRILKWCKSHGGQ